MLLDQRLIAGLGNIYAAESLWHARISPTTPASSLSLEAGRASSLGDSPRDQARDGCAIYGFVGVAAGGLRSRREACRRDGTPSSASCRRAVDVLLSDVSTLTRDDVETHQPASAADRGRSRVRLHSWRRRRVRSPYHSTALDSDQRIRGPLGVLSVVGSCYGDGLEPAGRRSRFGAAVRSRMTRMTNGTHRTTRMTRTYNA